MKKQNTILRNPPLLMLLSVYCVYVLHLEGLFLVGILVRSRDLSICLTLKEDLAPTTKKEVPNISVMSEWD